MRDAFKETGKRLLRLVPAAVSALVSHNFAEVVSKSRDNWTVALREPPPRWLTEETLAPWVQPLLGIVIITSLVWALWPVVSGAFGWTIGRLRGSQRTGANYGVPASHHSNKYIVGGRAEDEPGQTIGPMRIAEALQEMRASAEPALEYIPIEDAGRWIYENASPRIREILKGGVPSPFETIAQHGAAFYRTAWTEGRCHLYGRWELGLPMELVDPKDGDFSPFETVFGSDRRRPIDLSVLRQDLKPVLEYYEREEPAPSRETVNVVRDKPLREALMFIVTRQWHFDPMTDGGDHLKGLSDALMEFRQHASDGAITVWGKADRYGVWQRIEPKYWVNHYVDLLDVLKPETRAKAYNQLATEPLFQELMVCRAEFEWEWRQVEA